MWPTALTFIRQGLTSVPASTALPEESGLKVWPTAARVCKLGSLIRQAARVLGCWKRSLARFLGQVGPRAELHNWVRSPDRPSAWEGRQEVHRKGPGLSAAPRSWRHHGPSSQAPGATVLSPRRRGRRLCSTAGWGCGLDPLGAVAELRGCQGLWRGF